MQEIKPVKIGPKENAMRVTIEIAIRHPGSQFQQVENMKVDMVKAQAFVAVDNTTSATKVLKDLKPAIVDALATMRKHKVKPTSNIIV